MSNKPKPPPLETPANAASDVPHAESGKATLADATIASAKANAAERAGADARTAAAAEPDAGEGSPAVFPPAASGVVPPLPGQVPSPASPTDQRERPGAYISDRSGQFIARPDPTKPISTTDEVVHGNWVGRFKDQNGDEVPAVVKHGTPIHALPRKLQALIRETRGQVVGVLPPKQAPNPFTP